MSKLQDLTGRKFFYLKVIERAPNKKGQTMWRCVCENDGNEVVVSSQNLKNGHTRSCGCLQKNITSKRSIKHGQYGTRLYKIYSGILTRCYNPKHKKYEYYGGRGITVCSEWLGEYGADNFVKWAHENGYRDILTIDRIDNNGNYEPSNCRWVTKKEQANNRKTCHQISYGGETRTVVEWAEALGMNESTLFSRLNTYHWSVEKALTTPVKPRL